MAADGLNPYAKTIPELWRRRNQCWVPSASACDSLLFVISPSLNKRSRRPSAYSYERRTIFTGKRQATGVYVILAPATMTPIRFPCSSPPSTARRLPRQTPARSGRQIEAIDTTPENDFLSRQPPAIPAALSLGQIMGDPALRGQIHCLPEPTVMISPLIEEVIPRGRAGAVQWLR